MDHSNNNDQMDDTFQSENIRRNGENMNSDGLSICGQSNAPENISENMNSDDFDADLDNHDEPNSLMHDRDAMEVVSDDPYIGKEFNSAEAVQTFYNSYAFRLGFSIRKASQYKARKQDGMMTSMLLTCSKEGQSNVRDYDRRSSTTTQGQVTPTKEFAHKRSGCKALMRVKMIKGGKWVVTRFTEEHNHDLIASPTKTRFLRSHRSISNEQKQVIQLLRDQNISTSQIMSYIAARDGGSQNINFTMKDLSNEIVRYEKEEEEEFKTTNGESSLWSLNPIEKQAREIYTKHLRDATGFGVVELEQYKLYQTTLLENIYTLKQGSCSYKVAIEVETEKICCNCKQFEFTGILCPHALRVMQHVGMNFIPTRYILKRWTKNAKKGMEDGKLKLTSHCGSSNGTAHWYDSLNFKVQQFVYEGSRNLEAYKLACHKIDAAIEELKSLNLVMGNRKKTTKEKQCDYHDVILSQSTQLRTTMEECIVKDPPQSNCKGKRKPQRYKPSAERKAKKSRTCPNCKKKGHNIRTCKEGLTFADCLDGESSESSGTNSRDASEG
ncbi:Protein FAR1-RELATED SEQUENCE 5 [Ananas comosus]|uniref:Protein FAR1-RELATED SEQUENCE 5 n=1 Tax=Ananas comosus TaxID=4615 RepID=A0A199VBM9_ANACO|nr:Protein FAR1-RELATED SEQUENCE 5 [Ananas comosus]